MQIEIERQHQLDFDEDLLDEVEFQGGLPGPIMTALNTKKGMVLSKPKRHGQLDEFERLGSDALEDERNGLPATENNHQQLAANAHRALRCVLVPTTLLRMTQRDPNSFR